MTLLFLVMAVMLPGMSQVFVGSGFLQALEHSKVAMYSALARNLVMVSGYYLMALIFNSSESIYVYMGAIEIWGGALMAWLAWKYIKKFERDFAESDRIINLSTKGN